MISAATYAIREVDSVKGVDLLPYLPLDRQITEELRIKLREAYVIIEKQRAALIEINSVARCSEGVEFYAMLAERGLET